MIVTAVYVAGFMASIDELFGAIVQGVSQMFDIVHNLPVHDRLQFYAKMFQDG
jgi:hypothetical protein